MEFNLVEKLSIVQAIDAVVLADGHISDGEVAYMTQLGLLLGFSPDFVDEARKFNVNTSLEVLRNMSDIKKAALGKMLTEMANADGHLDEKEAEIIFGIFVMVGIKLDLNEYITSELDLSDIYFESSSHKRYQSGIEVSSSNGVARRAVKIESNINGNEGYSVTIYNLDGKHPVWGSNIQMSSKPMKVISSESGVTVLRGYGEDPRAMGHPDGSFAHYGISISHSGNEIESITLHLHDKGVDIIYNK